MATHLFVTNLMHMARVIDMNSLRFISVSCIETILLDNPFFNILTLCFEEVLTKQSLGDISVEYVINWFWNMDRLFYPVVVYIDEIEG